MIPFHFSVRFRNEPTLTIVYNHCFQKVDLDQHELPPSPAIHMNNEQPLTRLLRDHRYLALCGKGQIHVFGRGLKLLGQIDHWSMSQCIPLLDSGLVTFGHDDVCFWNGHYKLVHRLENVRDMSVFHTPDDIDEYQKQLRQHLVPYLINDICTMVVRYVI